MTEPPVRRETVTRGQLVTLVVPVSPDLLGQVRLDQRGLKEVLPGTRGRLDLKALPAVLALRVDRVHKEQVAPLGQRVSKVLLVQQEIAETLVRLVSKDRPELQATLVRRASLGIQAPPVIVVPRDQLESLVRRARMVRQVQRAFRGRQE